MEAEEALKLAERLLPRAAEELGVEGLRPMALRTYRGDHVPAFDTEEAVVGYYDPESGEFVELSAGDVVYAGTLSSAPAYVVLSDPGYEGEVLADPDVWDFASHFRLLEGGRRVAEGYFIDDLAMLTRFDEAWVGRHVDELAEILRGYRRMLVDKYRGVMTAGGRAAGWLKAAEGWVGLGAGLDEALAFIKDLYDGRVRTDFPVLIVVPQSSNVCVQYFDVWVREEDVERFRELAGGRLADEFSFERGVYVKVNV